MCQLKDRKHKTHIILLIQYVILISLYGENKRMAKEQVVAVLKIEQSVR